MENINVFDIFTHIAALYVIVFQIRHGHDNDICVHFHHQSDQAFFSNVIGSDLRMFFGKLENLIFRIACHIVDYDISMIQ